MLEPNYLSFRLLAKNSQELIRQDSAQGAVFFSFSFFGILIDMSSLYQAQLETPKEMFSFT